MNLDTDILEAIDAEHGDAMIVAVEDCRIEWVSESLVRRFARDDSIVGLSLGELGLSRPNIDALFSAQPGSPVYVELPLADGPVPATIFVEGVRAGSDEYLQLRVSLATGTIGISDVASLPEVTPEQLEITPAPVLVWDIDTQEIYEANRRMEELWGRPGDNFVGKSAREFTIDAEQLEQRMRYRLAQASPSYDEMQVLGPNGEVRTWIASSSVVRYSGRPCFFSAFTDVTDRRVIEDRLRRSEERYSLLVNSVPEAIIVHNGERILWANEQVVRLVNADRIAQVLNLPLLQLMHPDSREVAATRSAAVIREGVPAEFLHERIVRFDGEVVDVEISAAPTVYDGRPAALVVVRDISESLQARAALEASEEKYRTIVQGVNDTIFQVDVEGRFTFFRGSSEIGFDFEDVAGKSFTEFVHRDDLAALMKSFKRTLSGTLKPHEFRVRDQSGAWRHVRTSSKPVYDRDGNVTGLIGVMVDLTERIEHEQALSESEARLRVAQDLTGVHSVELDAQTGDWTVPDTFADRLGVLDLHGECRSAAIKSMLPEEHRSRVRKAIDDAIRTRSGFNLEFPMSLADGTTIYMRMFARYGLGSYDSTPRVFAALQEITEQKRQEDERLKILERSYLTQKMDGLGVLAGGVAHDFNNLLTGILGYTELIHSIEPAESKVGKYAHEIEDITRRAAGLTQQLLAYAGRGKLFVEKRDLSDIVDDFMPLVRASIPKHIDFLVDLESALPSVDVDASQVQHLVMNLVLNAAEAVADGAGQISIRTRVLNVAEDIVVDTNHPLGIASGAYAVLEVEDNGAGIEPDELPKIFEPFFTTKFIGRGLGLSAVHGIVQGHGGGIEIDSTPGSGTRIRVLIPAALTTAGESRNGQNLARKEPDEPAILVVDDDANIRELVEEILRTAGFTVVQASSGEECVRYIKERAFKGVFLDVALPNLSGDRVYHMIRQHQAELPVVLSSGSTQDELAGLASHDPAARFLQKPFKSETLLRELRSCIANSAKAD